MSMIAKFLGREARTAAETRQVAEQNEQQIAELRAERVQLDAKIPDFQGTIRMLTAHVALSVGGAADSLSLVQAELANLVRRKQEIDATIEELSGARYELERVAADTARAEDEKKGAALAAMRKEKLRVLLRQLEEAAATQDEIVALYIQEDPLLTPAHMLTNGEPHRRFLPPVYTAYSETSDAIREIKAALDAPA